MAVSGSTRGNLPHPSRRVSVSQLCVGDLRPIPADPWIISSLLQKSIRRGEVAIAQRAALTLLNQRGSVIWRRLMIIAFEDIGAGSPDAVAMTVAVGSDRAFRSSIGGSSPAAAGVADLLCKSAKDRSAEYLGCGPRFHPELFVASPATALSSLERQLAIVADRDAPLFLRTLAAWHACGIGREGSRTGDLPTLLETYRKLGAPEVLLEATGIAAQRTREPITVMVPLIWLAARGRPQTGVENCPLPPLVCEGEVPLYALDGHTRLGRQAIFRFAQSNDAVRECLECHVTGPQRQAAYLAAFYTDGYPISSRLMWQGCLDAEQFGIDNDLLLAGVRFEGIEPLLQVFRGQLGELNAVRRAVFRSAQAAQQAQAGLSVRGMT